MNRIKRVLLGIGASVGIVFVPVSAMAAVDTGNTTINASIQSVISVATSSTVAISVTPVTGGAQTTASDTVTVNSNNAAGYTLTLGDSDTDTDLENGANSIAAHAGTYASPTALANNSWGYAVGGLGTFDASYSVLTNVTTSTSKWAGVPSSASPQQIKDTSSVASNDATTVWYSVKADTSKPNGTYTDTVTYTATTK